MWKQLLQRSSRESLSLQAQIREMLVGAILDGQLPAGEPVPPSREMADQLAWRATPSCCLPAARRRGLPGLAPAQRPLRQRRDDRQAPAAWARSRRPRLARQGVSTGPHASCSTRRASAASSSRPTGRNIRTPSCTASSTLAVPTADWRECCNKALSVLDIRDWAPDLITRDDESLVQQIRTCVLPRRGVWAAADEVVITVGAARAVHAGRPAGARGHARRHRGAGYP